MPYWVTVSWTNIPTPEVNIVAGPYASSSEAGRVAQQLLKWHREQENANPAFQQLKSNLGEAGAREKIRFDADSEEHLRELVRKGAHFGYNTGFGEVKLEYVFPLN